jgi:hypothetical protein
MTKKRTAKKSEAGEDFEDLVPCASGVGGIQP